MKVSKRVYSLLECSSQIALLLSDLAYKIGGPERKDISTPPSQLPVHPHLCRPCIKTPLIF